MKATVWHGERDVRIEEVPDPTLVAETDALLRVTTAAICGTDLHAYHGQVPGFTPGIILGHEFMGVVERVGSAVTKVKPGDRVVASDIIACGRCWYCQRGQHWNCPERTLFGYGPAFGPSVAGGQAQLVRVPHADTVLIPVPPDLRDEQVLFVGDILTTGYLCALNGGIRPGDTVAVVGCGPVGLFAQRAAQLLGAARVFGIDQVASRLELARRIGSVPVDFRETDPRTAVMNATDGRGADVVLEAVGGAGPLDTAWAVVRPHGTISIVGVHLEDRYPFPATDAFVRELTVRFAVGDPMTYARDLIPLIQSGAIDPPMIVSHRIGLDDVPEGYRLFDRRDATKILVHVS